VVSGKKLSIIGLRFRKVAMNLASKVCNALRYRVGAFFAAWLSLLPVVVSAVSAPVPQLTDADVVWDMRVLSLDDSNAAIDAVPQLHAHRGLILDRAGLHSVSPRMIVMLLETSGALADMAAMDTEQQRARIDAVIASIGRMHYLGRSIAKTAAQARMTDDGESATPAANNSAGVAAVAATFVNGEARLESLSALYLERFGPSTLERQKSLILSPAVFSTNTLRLPWTLGQYNWGSGGVHTTFGGCPAQACAYPRSSLDFWRPGWGWNSDTSSGRVVAANAGTVTKYSACQVRVTSPDGWATNYYHLDGILVNTGDVVYAGQRLSGVANTEAAALCQGGSSTGPHFHFSLINAGAHVDIDQSEFSGWKVNAAAVNFDYDTNCTRMYFTRAGITACPNSPYSPTAWAMHTLPATMPSNQRCTFDIDGNGTAEAATDGVLLLRYMLGLRGNALIAGAVGLGASRQTATDIQNFITSKNYDLDLDDTQQPTSDALLVSRLMRGQSGAALASGAARSGSFLTAGEQIAAYAAGCR
jgi:LasA protease